MGLSGIKALDTNMSRVTRVPNPAPVAPAAAFPQPEMTKSNSPAVWGDLSAN